MYLIKFAEEGSFEGGPFYDSKWNEMPDKPIDQWEYDMFGKKIVLAGFEAYNHVVERVQFVNKAGGGVLKIILMAKHKDEVLNIVFDCQTKMLTKEVHPYGKEYNNAPTFLFYETVKGFYFRTIDSMMDRKNPRFIYRELTPNTIRDGESRPNSAVNLTNILNYEVLPTTDVMMKGHL